MIENRMRRSTWLSPLRPWSIVCELDVDGGQKSWDVWRCRGEKTPRRASPHPLHILTLIHHPSALKMANVAILSAQTYTFDQRKVANWSTTQEKQISTDYPFTITAEPIEQTVARTYLQFLWLPEARILITYYCANIKKN